MSPATLQLIDMVLGAVLRLVPETQEDIALAKQWIAFCKAAISENRDFTADEVAQAHSFAQSEHDAIQQS